MVLGTRRINIIISRKGRRDRKENQVTLSVKSRWLASLCALGELCEKRHLWFTQKQGRLKRNGLVHLLHEALQFFAPAGMAELPERLGFDLADALAGNLEVLAHL